MLEGERVTTLPTSSALGFGMSCTFCSAVLPIPSPSLTPVYITVTAIQPPLGLGTNPTTRAPLPSTVAGRQLLSEAIERRIATARGTLPDTKAPTTTGNYGVDLLDEVDADMTQSDAGRLAASVDAQCRQDERVFYSHTTATIVGSTLPVVIQLVDGAGPFRLTKTIDLVTGTLLGSTT